MLRALLSFLFGRQTDIFNKKGRVEHDLGAQKWEAWNNRLAKNPNYDWTKHTGKTGHPTHPEPTSKEAQN